MNASKTFTYFIKSQTGDLERGFQRSSRSAATLEKNLDSLKRSELDVRDSALKVQRAQDRLTATMKKYEAGSVQAKQAQINLERAQLKHADATDAARVATLRGTSAQEKANAQAKSGVRHFDTLGGSLRRVAATAGGMYAVGAATRSLINNFATFEQNMNEVRAVTGANERQMKSLSNAARDLGLKTGLGAGQAAKAIAELSKGGVSAEKIIRGGLAGSIALAQAGSMELADAASTTANALNLFALDGSKATKIADSLANAANATTADVADFGMALSQGGGAAKAAGASFSETVLALEALAKAGIKNSDAGTSLKASLAKLVNPSNAATAAMQKYGIDLFNSAGNMKSMSNVSEILRDKTSKLTREQRLQLFQQIAGTDGFRTLLALYDAGPKKLDAWKRGLEKSGTAQKVAADKNKGYYADLKKLKATWEELSITIGEEAIPPLERLLKKLTPTIQDFARGTGEAGKFRDTLVGIVKPFGSIARAAFNFTKNNPELATAAASFAIIGGGAAKLSKLTGAGGLIKFAFGRGNTPVTPMYVYTVNGGGVGGKGPLGKTPVPVTPFTGPVSGPVTATGVAAVGSQSKAFRGGPAIGTGAPAGNDAGFGLTKFLRVQVGALLGLDKALDKSKGEVDEYGRGIVRSIRRSWAAVRSDTDTSMSDINRTVSRNMRRVARAMDRNSADGAAALRSNVNGAVSAIERQMGRGTVSVERGMARINQLLSSELKQLGVTYLAADGNSPAIQAGALPTPKIKRQGSTGVVAPGAEIGGARMDGPRVSSDSRSGGGGGGGGTFAARGPAAKLRDWLANKGFSTTSEGRSDSDTYHGMGLALDYGTSSNDLNRLSKILWPARRQFEELFIPTWAPHGGLYHNGNKFSNSKLQAGHQDHIHVAESSKFTPPEIRIPRVKMRRGLGALTVIGQAALDRSRKAAIRHGNRLIEAGGARYDAPGYKSKYGIKDLTRLALYGGFRGHNAAVAAAVAMAESSGETKQASTQGNSPPSTDRGLWQINSYWNKNISDAEAYSPTKAAQAAYRIHKSRGWRDWVVYNTGAYRRYLPAAEAALKTIDPSKGGGKKSKKKGESRAARLGRHYGWDAKQGARASFYESAYTTAVARGDWATVRMTVRAALKFWRGVLSRAVAAGDGEGITAAQAQVDDWKTRPTAPTTAESPWATSDDKHETGYLLASQSGDDNWTQNEAINGLSAAQMRVRQYSYGLTHGDSRVTGAMLSEAIGAVDTWKGRVSVANGGTMTRDGAGAASLDDVLNELKALNAGKDRVLATTGGKVIEGLIHEMASFGIGSSFNLSNQAGGRGAGLHASY